VSVYADLEYEQIRVAFQYDPELVQRIKQIPGRKFDPETKTWLLPQPQWKNFVQAFKDVGLEVPPEQFEDLQQLEHPTFQPITQIQDFKGTLYPFQAEAVGFLISRKRCLLADEMGLGKTISAIASALELRNYELIRRVLVFCPKTIITQWVNEYKRFADERAVAIEGDKAQREHAYRQASATFFVITNYETVLREASKLADLKPDLVILDEAQRIGTYNAKTTKQINAHFKTPYRWALTGTPLENALAEIHSILNWVDPGILGPWFLFKNTYLIYGGFRHKHIVGHRNLDHLHEQIRDWMLRRRKRQVLHDLPPITVNNYYVELNGAEHEIYGLIHEELGKYYKLFKQTRGEQGSGDILAQLMYLRECCDHLALVFNQEVSSKLAELLQILRDLGDVKVVVFTEFERLLHIIASKLSVGHAALYGAMTQQQRVQAINAFNNDPACQVFLSTEAGGLGVNLQVASHLVNLELHWNPARLQQRLGRLHRIGQKDTVTCINLIAKDTIEERVLNVINEKTDLFRKVVDGDFFNSNHEGAVWRILAEEFLQEASLYVA